MTDFLFSTPNFLSGMGKAIDLGGTMMVFNASDSPAEADRLALLSDWGAVGADIYTSIEKAHE